MAAGKTPAPAPAAAPAKAAPKATPKPSPAPAAAAPAAAPAAAAPAASGPKISWGAWLLSQFRLVMHLLMVSATGWITYDALRVMPTEDADRSTAMMLGGFGLAAVLGLTSLLTIFIGRRIHHAVSKLFFGLAILLVALNIFAELMISGWETWSAENPIQCVLTLSMLGCSALALGAEVLCRRLGIVTRWQVPWSGD